jgi:hypothetical protein
MIPKHTRDLETQRPPFGARDVRVEDGRPRLCLLTTLHPERGLSLALVKHLTEEVPGILFTLEDRAGVDVVWVCGYEHGNAATIRALRAAHPENLLIVTGKEPEDLWAPEVLAAGADSALSWPLDVSRLGQVLRHRPLQRRA